MKESVKISGHLVDRIRKYVKTTGQTISGYIDVRLAECIQQDEKEKRTFEEVGKLSKESNKKKR